MANWNIDETPYPGPSVSPIVTTLESSKITLIDSVGNIVWEQVGNFPVTMTSGDTYTFTSDVIFSESWTV